MAPPPRVFRLLPGYKRGGPSAPSERRSDRYARRDRTASAGAVLVSVAFHALVLVLWPALTIATGDLFDPDSLRPAEAPVQVVRLRAHEPDATPAPALASALPVLSLDLPAVTLVDAPTPRAPNLSVASATTPDWKLPPRPVEAGASTASADANVFVRPVALSILTNWRPRVPSDGVEVTVRVHTDATGRATGLVELVPHTPGLGLNREIAARVRQLTFQPALSDGEPVAAWAEITLVICPDGVTATSPASPSGVPNPCAARVGVAAQASGG